MPNADDMLDLPVDDAQVDRMACAGLPTLPPGLVPLPHTQQQQRKRQATTTLEPLAACTLQPDDDASAVAPRRAAPFINPRPLMHSPLERLDHSDESDSEDSSLTTDVLMFSPSPTMADAAAHRERNADTSSDADDNVPQPLTNTSNLSTPPQPATAAASALLSPASSMVSVLSPGVTPGQGSKAVLTRSFAETVKMKL